MRGLLTDAESKRGPANSPEPPAPLDMRGVVLNAALAMVVFTGVAALLGWLFYAPLIRFGQWFVANFGGIGVAVGYFVPDAFTVPLPNDAFTAFGLWGGMPFWEVVAWGSLGSIAGGSTGWALGRYLFSRSKNLKAFIKRRGGDEMIAQLRRGERWFLAIAAVTPIPYSITCWAAGIIKMPFVEFLLISLLRIPRVGVFLWLLQKGFVSISGVEIGQ